MIRLLVSHPLGSFLALSLKFYVVEHLLFDHKTASCITDFSSSSEPSDQP